ncbi:hypothetical protein EUTSA_v10009077mg [Eutrema salsugineum]|uniref:Uncharacterized protein n=1 Tax=Eutrema salsugineum TaxID=72664 RepID=V4L194_EUTSA|nr:hypothetical protein EUTSA_v10009077mg [Eutrema salsugineum]
MDYSLAAVKMLISQLRDAKPTSSQNATALGGVLFQRAWLQGVLVFDQVISDGRMVLDDGTGLVELGLCSDFAHRQWKSGFGTIFISLLVFGLVTIVRIKNNLFAQECT